MLGDDYIAQHISQAYREYVERVSYRSYMSSMVKGIASMISGNEISSNWSDILPALYGPVIPEKKTETEQEIKSRILAKLNGREDE